MSLRSRMRDLERYVNFRRSAAGDTLQDENIEELFRRSDAQLDMQGLQNRVNSAAYDRNNLQDEAIGALLARIEAVDDDGSKLSRLVGADIRALRERVAALEPDDDSEEIAADGSENEEGLVYAIENENVVTFKYRDREGASSYRVVSPYELQDHGFEIAADLPLVDTYVSVLGYDHGREGIRHFRIERIEGAVWETDVEQYRPPNREETL